MILPSGELKRIIQTFVGSSSYCFLGCLSPEQRCISAPLMLINDQCKDSLLLKIVDPPDAFPDRSHEASISIAKNEALLTSAGLHYSSVLMNLLATEDELLDILPRLQAANKSTTLIFDITSFPKRYFCFLVMKLMKSNWQNVLVTYTDAADYPKGHLSEDPMTSEYLPGFTPKFDSKKARLVITAGFEPLRIRSIIEHYAEKPNDTKIILSFPPDGLFIRRQWKTIIQIFSGRSEKVNTNNLKTIATWDTSEVYHSLDSWYQEAGNLVLAPFGAKPHTLGMSLFATCHDCAVVYTQPKSYSPFYTIGQGEAWAYVIKWDGIPCYDRKSVLI